MTVWDNKAFAGFEEDGSSIFIYDYENDKNIKIDGNDCNIQVEDERFLVCTKYNSPNDFELIL